MLEYYKIRTKKIKLIEKYNIFKEIPIDKSEEKFFEIFKNDKIKIEKIVSNGQKSPDNFGMNKKKVSIFCFWVDMLF